MAKKRIRFLVIIVLAAVMGGNSFFVAFSQAALNLQIDSIVDNSHPNIEVYVSVFDERNTLLRSLDKNHFSLSESGIPVEDFQVTTAYEKSLAVVIAMDVSESMGYKHGESTTVLERSVARAKEIVNALGENDQVAILAFSEKVVIAQGLTTDKNKALEALDSLKPDKNASLYEAIYESALLLDNFSGRRAVVLFADSADGGYLRRSLDEAIGMAQQKNVSFLPVFWNAARPQEMSNLARQTNGKDFNLGGQANPDAQSLAASASEIRDNLRLLREQYLIRFTSSLPASGTEYDLVVKVNYQGAYAEQSRKFTAQTGNVTVDLTNLQDGQSVFGNVEIVPQVSAPAALARMEIWLDGQLLDTVFGQPFKYMWDTSQASIGLHTLKVLVVDGAGNTGSRSVNLNVQPILVTIKSPQSEAIIEQITTVEAEIQSVKTIARVEIILNTEVLETITASGSTSVTYALNPRNLGAARHTLTVKAYDADGFSGEASIPIVVAPSDGGLGIGIAILVVLALAGILIPFGLRSRKKKRKSHEAVNTASNFQGLLRELSGINPGQVWPLVQAETRLGRKANENDIPLKGTGASRHHAVIQYDGSQYTLSVLNPANPMLVNQKPVSSQAVLQIGDVLQAGESTFRFE